MSNVLMIRGSLRKGSFNRALMNAPARQKFRSISSFIRDNLCNCGI
jgi:hypothetical protein